MKQLPDELFREIAQFLSIRQIYSLIETATLFQNCFNKRQMRFDICKQKAHCPFIKMRRCACSTCPRRVAACYHLEGVPKIVYISNYCSRHHTDYYYTDAIDLIY